MLAGGWAVRVDVNTPGTLVVGLPGHYPPVLVELVAKVVCRYDVQHADVHCITDQPSNLQPQRRKHAPGKEEKVMMMMMRRRRRRNDLWMDGNGLF